MSFLALDSTGWQVRSVLIEALDAEKEKEKERKRERKKENERERKRARKRLRKKVKRLKVDIKNFETIIIRFTQIKG